MKRSLPTLRSLEMFEVAARHESFTRAAEELAVTQSALSRQIALLEAHLDAKLFERIRKRVVLTELGAQYAEKVRIALDRIRSVTMDVLTAGAGGEVLHVVSLATFAAMWLAPRLATFAQANPDIQLKVTTYHHHAIGVLDREADVFIHHGEPSWPGGILEPMMRETIVAVCSPAFLKRRPLRTLNDLMGAPLLQQLSRPYAWIEWLVAAGGPRVNAVQGPVFEQYSMIIAAALSGMGVAAVPQYLVKDDLRAGRLVMPFAKSVRGRHSYYLVVPEAKRNLPRIQKFRRWLLREIKLSQSRSEGAAGTG